MTAPALPPDMLAEVTRLMRETRRLIETSTIPFDAAFTVVSNAAFILSARKHGMTREQLMTAFGNLYDLAPNP